MEMELNSSLYTLMQPLDLGTVKDLIPGVSPQIETNKPGETTWRYHLPACSFELVQMAQTDIHEHLMAALAYIGSLESSLPPAKLQKLMDSILASGNVLSFSCTGQTPEPALFENARKKLGFQYGGVWLMADGFFDTEGKLILGVDGDGDATARLEAVPPMRRTLAQFLFTALNQEREELEEAGRNPSETTPLDEAYRHAEIGYQRALKYGFKEDEDIFALVSIMFSIGPNFDDHPELRKILQNESLTPRQRLDAMVDHPNGERIWEEAEHLIDLSRWDS